MREMYRAALDALLQKSWTELLLSYIADLWKKSSYPSLRQNPSSPNTPTHPPPRGVTAGDNDYHRVLSQVHHKDCPCGGNFLRSNDKCLQVHNEYLASSTLAVPDSVEISKSKQMCIGRKKFNIDPKKGIEYLIENVLLTHSAKDIAEFLLKGEGLNKSIIGKYLCEYNEFNQEVLKEFIEQQDFKDLLILQALRQFLWSFHPMGEYQKIERVLRGFAKHYCSVNPNIFSNPEKCFNLSESIILLNTIMHNPSIKKKITKDMFVEMVNDDGEISAELLESIYESIRDDPLKKDDGDDLMHTFFNPDREGWLLKQGGRYKSWKRRWFILTDRCLYYFEFTTDKVPRGIIPLENIKIRDVQDRRMPNCFELFNESSDIVKACKTISNGKMVEGRHSVYRISAVSPEVKKEWMEAIRKSTMYSPFYDLLSKDKNKSNKQ